VFKNKENPYLENPYYLAVKAQRVKYLFLKILLANNAILYPNLFTLHLRGGKGEWRWWWWEMGISQLNQYI